MKINNNLKTRFKLYKAGKMWLVAGTAFLVLAGLGSVAVHADNTDNQVQTTVNTDNNSTINHDDIQAQVSNETAVKSDDTNQTAEVPAATTENKASDNNDKTVTDNTAKSERVATDSKNDENFSKSADNAELKIKSPEINNQVNTDNKHDEAETNKNDANDSVNVTDGNEKNPQPADNNDTKSTYGWNADHTQYMQDDGQLATGVQKIDGTYYDFDENHNIVKNNYVQSQWGSWYMFGDNGQIATKVTPWAGTYYYFDPETYLRVDNNYVQSQWGSWYMFGNDGRVVSGVTPWAGTYYYFDPETYLRVDNNYVQSQWGDWYMFGNDGQIATKVTPWAGTYYYFDPETYLRVDNNYIQSQWGSWYMFGNDGRVVSGVTPWAGTYYYFDPETYLRVDNNYVQSQWGDWYMFGSNGQIVSGLTPWAGTYYYFDPSTYLRVDNQAVQTQFGTYYFGEQGQIMTDAGTKDNLDVQLSPQRQKRQQALDKMIGWMTDRSGKVSYSMIDRNGPNSYDCSSAVYHALAAAGFLPEGSNGSTDNEFGDLEHNGWGIVPANSYGVIPATRGDIFIWGDRGHSVGGAGHTGIFYDNNGNIIHCNYGNDGITTDNHNRIWELHDNPTVTVYRYYGNI